ncbi:MAG: hypothetical protein MUO22_07185 [Sedimentisphaerales bacterium]|nr:hypothetical protein [Sedimentisphaerales bacterium]
MSREWIESSDIIWESLEGTIPNIYLDMHPSRKFVAMQVGLSDNLMTERAAIWNTKTHKIHWCSENASALCWIENGTELLVIDRMSQHGKERPSLYTTTTQNEYKYFMRRLSWPALDTISSIELNFPLGWLIDIVPSPTDKLACFVWQDQCESGIEFVSWQQSELKQLPDIGFYGNSNRIQGPVFSSDGAVLAMSFGAGFWWAETPDEPSPGGDFNAGYLIWSETGSGNYNRIDINISIPTGWKPHDPSDILHNEFLSKPEFISTHEVKVVLPTGEERLLPLVS